MSACGSDSEGPELGTVGGAGGTGGTGGTSGTGGTATGGTGGTSTGGTGGACTPTTCADEGAECGTIDDGCGTPLDCGTCTAPDTCGTDNTCSCTPTTCADEGANCGTIDDGCSGTLDCGTCTDPETCGGSGTPNVCGEGTCTPTTCTDEGAECGTISDGCAGTLDCGTCTAPETCGADNTCSCTPTTCTDEGAECGTIDDGCNGTLDCGSCTSPETCGGSGTPNVCGTPCTPTTCVDEGAECGTIDNGCGATLDCGTCTDPEFCGGDGTPNVCSTPSNWPTAGDLVITEIMYNPLNSPEDDFEWFEIYNPSATDTFNLAGCVLSESTRSHTISASLAVAPGAFITLASSDSPEFMPDYVHDRDVFLVNSSSGSMTITCGTTVIDTVDYETSGAWPSSTNGSGIALDPAHYDATDNDDGANWCLASSTYGTSGNLGTPGVTNDSCGCTPITSCPSPLDCGDIDDTCGGTINCGTCTAPETCGGDGTANVCGQGTCTPTTCAAEGADCGTISDECGGTLNCGTCTAPETCGGGGTLHVCGCTPTTCTDEGAECGAIDDGCGNALDCGDCTAPETCAGGGVENICGCTSTTCAAQGAECGTIPDGCGTALDCGGCTAPEVCGGAGVANVCSLPHPTASMVIFTEIMQNPDAVPDATGEWFEVYNISTTASYNLEGCIIEDDGSDSYTIPSSLVIGPGGYLTFAISDSPGFTPNHVYTGIDLANGADELRLVCSSVTIDEVAWDGGVTFPNSGGTTMTLDPIAFDATSNDDGSNWCDATSDYNDDLGTPGAANDTCSCVPLTQCPGSLECGDYPDGCGGFVDCGTCTLPEVCGAANMCEASSYPPAGAVIFTEVMQDPTTVGDNGGEWFELHNTSTTATYSLQDCIIEDDGTDDFTIGTALTIGPGDYLTFANGASPGFTPDFEYTGMSLSNSDDELRLVCNTVTIDEIAWDNGVTFPDPTAASMTLDPGSFDATSNDDGANWCVATTSYNGDLGTPGATNDSCSCVPLTQCPVGLECGDYPDNCGGFVNCGTCTLPETCGGGGTDNMCGGDAYPPAGALIFTEVMQNPTTVGDNGGEWFELHNTSSTATYSLQDCTIEDDGSDDFTIDTALTIGPGDYLTFSNGADPGFTPDFVYTGMDLGNGSDELRLICNTVTIDEIAWDDGATFPSPAGASMNLDPSSFDATSNDDGTNWCVATASYNGDLGTPGADNTTCGSTTTYNIDYCRLQYPQSMISIVGDQRIVYGRLYISGLTNLSHGNDTDAAVIGQVGYGANDSDPNGWTNWTAATPNSGWDDADDLNNDEYQATMTIPAASATHYDYAFRFSGDGGSTWTYCDIDGSTNDYNSAQAGDLLSKTAHSIDWCRLQSPSSLSGDEGTASATVYGRLYIEGLTDLSDSGNDTHPLVVGQVGYGPDGDTAFDTAWTWTAATENSLFDPDGAGEPNNDEYEGSFTLPPASGNDYDFAFRFSGDGGTTWTYCDLDGDAYSVGQAGSMTTTAVSVGTLFFSEYIENGNDKAVELYNPTGATIDLSAASCSVLIYSNGSSSANSPIALTGTIAAGATYTLCYTPASFSGSCDQTHGSLSFNGDDAVELSCGGTTLDVIGEVGFDPGTSWSSGGVSTEDDSIRRKCGIDHGDTDGSNAFDPSVEFDSFGDGEYGGLGAHTFTCP